MKKDVIYRIREGPLEYAIWSDAKWLGPSCMPNFHRMETLEAMPRQLIIHQHAIQKLKTDGNHN